MIVEDGSNPQATSQNHAAPVTGGPDTVVPVTSRRLELSAFGAIEHAPLHGLADLKKVPALLTVDIHSKQSLILTAFDGTYQDRRSDSHASIEQLLGIHGEIQVQLGNKWITPLTKRGNQLAIDF